MNKDDKEEKPKEIEIEETVFEIVPRFFIKTDLKENKYGKT